MMTVSELLAARPGAAPFLLSATGGWRVSYAEAAAAVGAWCRVLDDLPADATVGLSIVDPQQFCLAFLGVLSSGRCVLPVDPALPAALHAGAFASADLVISDARELRCLVPWVRADVYRDSSPGRAVGGGSLELRSSGTTGPAKLVRLTEQQLLYTASNVATHHHIVPGERGFSPLPLFHINAEVVGLLATLVGGATLVVDAGFHRSRFWDTVVSHRVTWANAVPAILAILAAAPQDPPRLPELRFVRSASAPLPDMARRAFETRFSVPVIESYGMTEAGSQITVNPLDGTRRPGSVGRPVGVQLAIRDEHGHPVGAGVTGTVYIRGAGVINAYAGRAGADSFDPDGWLDTGDVGYLDPDGFLFLVARRDDIINRGGEKVLPSVIEGRLLAHPEVLAAAVVKSPHPALGAVPEAFVVCRQPGRAAGPFDQLLSWCRDGLAPAQVPTAIHVVDELPVGPTGKVRRRELARQLAGLSRWPSPRRRP
jgi:acyl-CoA synthetase (AMP-forming)/AMP-acid ligase II